MISIYLRLTIIILNISLMSHYLGVPKNLPYTASENLVWKPYLQQLTATGVTILWTTNTGTDAVVRYSTDSSYGSVANGTSRSLNALNTQLHRVELTGLHANTTYYYKIYVEGEDLLPDEVLSFKTAPFTGSITPFTFLAFGDYGQGSSSQILLRDQMLLDSYDFILTTGDNAYGDGTYGQFDERVFQIYGDVFRRAAVFPTLGNHDYHTGAGAPYLDLFDLPDQSLRPGDTERYYSFDYGNAHFVALDSNTPLNANDAAATDDMFDWLRHDLSQTSQPWKIVAFHHAAYSTGRHGSDSRVQTKLVPIFEEYGVDLVLNGHDHIYQRSQPLRGGQVTTIEEGGIVYIVSGAGSRTNYECSDAPWSVITYCVDTQNWSGDGLYSRITINGDTLIGEAIDEEGMIRDYFVIEDNSLVFTPVENVSINGPTVGATQTDYNFTATVSPVTTTLPITYTWQATAQSPVTHTNSLSDAVTYTWNTTGTQAITVTASNIEGTVTDTHRVTITDIIYSNYLPIILHNNSQPTILTRAMATQQVTATVETAPVEGDGDAADDPAIWIHPTDPALSTIIGTDKPGGLEVYDLAGNKLQVIAGLPTNNVDIRYNFPLGGERVALVTAYSKVADGLVAFKVNPTTRQLEDVLAGQVDVAHSGTALYHSPVSGKYYYFSNAAGILRQYELFDNGNGRVDAALVRTVPFGSDTTEGVVADDILGFVYVSEEDTALWKLSAEPDGGSTKTLVDRPLSQGGHFVPDVEGLTIYYKSDGTGYLIASSQGNNTYIVYTREGDNQYLATFEIVADEIDAVSHTDGIDVTNFPLGDAFPEGLFVAQDGVNHNNQTTERQNFKLVPWGQIASKLGLDTDTDWDPRDVGAEVTPTPTLTPTPTSTPGPEMLKTYLPLILKDFRLTN